MIIKIMQKRPSWIFFHANIDVHSIRMIAEFPIYEIKCIAKLQSHCANMAFADKIRYAWTFQHVIHKGGESDMIYIKRFQYANALSIYV